jgi:hypothetical protein
LREKNLIYEGLFDEWLKLWQIRKEQANQAIDGETELEVIRQANSAPLLFHRSLPPYQSAPLLPYHVSHPVWKNRGHIT